MQTTAYVHCLLIKKEGGGGELPEAKIFRLQYLTDKSKM